VKSAAKKIAEIFVMSADLPDFENYISTEQIEEVSSAILVRAFMYVYICLWKYVYVYVIYVWQQESNSYV